MDKILIAEKLRLAKTAEENGEFEEAAREYEALIKEGYSDKLPFERLMIIYRKLKKYKDELRIINKGISTLSEENKRHLQENLTGKKNKKEIEKLSEVFM